MGSRCPRGPAASTRLTFLTPVSVATAIGTGGPFGAEGPIIATGGALGSLAGQLFRTTANERKTLLVPRDEPQDLAGVRARGAPPA